MCMALQSSDSGRAPVRTPRIHPLIKLTKEGPGHYVTMADFDNDGDDECLIALMGPSPYKVT